MNPDSRIYVAGHTGLVGSALVRRLRMAGHNNLVLRSRAELDLIHGPRVADFFAREKPEYVFVAAARVGGILANRDFPADFIRDNLAIELNLIEAARVGGVTKLLFLGSSCIYPRNAAQPIREEYLLTGPLEPTNEAYAIAKIAGIQLCQAYARQHGCRFISAMPTNLYGPGDDFDLRSSHVLPALIRKFHEAKVAGDPTVIVWGSGRPRREFLYVDDLADACVFLMEKYEDVAPINVGVGEDISIAKLAELVGRVVGYAGAVAFDPSKPDGAPRKLLDVSRMEALGWRAAIPLAEGIASTYEWYLRHRPAGIHAASLLDAR